MEKVKPKSDIVSKIVPIFALIGLALCFFEIGTNVYNELQTRANNTIIGAAEEE